MLLGFHIGCLEPLDLKLVVDCIKLEVLVLRDLS